MPHSARVAKSVSTSSKERYRAATEIDIDGGTLIIADTDAGDEAELQALENLMRRLGNWPPVVAVTRSFEATTARRLVQMRVADFLVKPVSPVELVRTCARVAKVQPMRTRRKRRFSPSCRPSAALARPRSRCRPPCCFSTAARGAKPRPAWSISTSNTALAPIISIIEPRLNIGEIEPSPERLDRQLLEVMLSHHGSGLAVIAAPNRPAEMRSFDPDVVIRLLDLVSSHFDFVVFDMPRTWFSWTDDVLLGSNKLFIVSETTVPGLRHAKQLVEAVRERLGDGPQPQVIINRYVQKLFSSGLRLTDIKQAIGDALVACVPNDYSLVREAIDRGVPLEEVKPGNKITTQLKKLILPQASGKAAEEAVGAGKKLKLSWARS